MEKKRFYGQLIGVTGFAGVVLLACYTYLPISDHVELGVMGLVFFIFLSMVIFHLAGKVAKAKNLNAFTHLILYNLMIKLFISFIIILGYYYVVRPTERLFILPFVAVYLIFTIFEAIFLSRQARQKYD